MYNTQRAHMYVIQQTAYVSDVEIGGTFPEPSVATFMEGVIFDVRPVVSADRKYITMELRPTTSELLNMRTFAFSGFSAAGDDVVVLTPFSTTLQQPELRIQRVRTQVTIPDGGILLIGGLMRNVKFHAENGVPVLKDIPVLGRLFRWDVIQNERKNLLIMVTGRIILFDEEERKRGF